MMTALQQNTMNTELWQGIGTIADDKLLMQRLSRYVKRLVKEKEDETLMSKEDFFARVDEARKGPSYELREGETIEDLLKRVG